MKNNYIFSKQKVRKWHHFTFLPISVIFSLIDKNESLYCFCVQSVMSLVETCEENIAPRRYTSAWNKDNCGYSSLIPCQKSRSRS